MFSEWTGRKSQGNPRDINTISRSCLPNLEHPMISCHPFYLPQEFSTVIMTAVYIPPRADTDVVLSALHDVLCRHQTQHPDTAVVVAGDFNRANLKKVMLNFRQHITCVTRGEKNFGPLLYAIRERLQGCLSSPVRQVGPCRHFPAARI